MSEQIHSRFDDKPLDRDQIKRWKNEHLVILIFLLFELIALTRAGCLG